MKHNDNIMRVLTVRQPWAHAIIHLGKDVENRVRNIVGDYRGPVAIHAGLRDDSDAWDDVEAGVFPAEGAFTAPTVRGAIIGVVDIVDVHLCSGGCSPWAERPVDLGKGFRDTWHLVLANPRPLSEPIPFKGALGLRKLDADTIAHVRAGLL